VLKQDPVIFLLDVDNTLLDNDRFGADLGDHLETSFGADERARYWEIFERRRKALEFADYLGSLQEFRVGLDGDPHLLKMSEFVLEYPFDSRLFPGALQAVAHLRTFGLPVVLSDGDIIFQPRKIQRAGIWAAVEGRVLIYVHKEKELKSLQHRYPAKHYVMVDDKANLLAAMKTALGDELTTVFVRQGHYALAAESKSAIPPPDLTIERIGDLLDHNLSDFEVRP
jgi:FMN phosphatase YigB (HAD superfamily)